MLKKMAKGLLTLAVVFVMAAGVYALDSSVPAQTSAATYTVKNLKLYVDGKQDKSYTRVLLPKDGSMPRVTAAEMILISTILRKTVV